MKLILINVGPFFVSLAFWFGFMGLLKLRSRQVRAKLAATRFVPLTVEEAMAPCPDCQSTCELCEGEGEVRCEMVRCGGQGFLALATAECVGTGCKAETGKIAPGCTLCMEAGVEVTQKADCPSCHGAGKVKCYACSATGKASTGRVGGAYQAHGGSPEPPMCPQCKGMRRVPLASTVEATSV